MAHGLQCLRFVRSIGTTLLIVGLSLSGVAVAADALVTTQREELESFVDDVTRDKPDSRIDGALGYINPSLTTVKLSAEGGTQVYAEGDSGELADAVRSALGVFDSSDQNLLQHSIRVEGNQATVTTRMGDSSYEQTVIYDLVRRDERWLVRSLRVL